MGYRKVRIKGKGDFEKNDRNEVLGIEGNIGNSISDDFLKKKNDRKMDVEKWNRNYI